MKYAVIGLGVSGYSVAEFLLNRQEECYLYDSRDEYRSRAKSDFDTEVLPFAGADFSDIDRIVLSPGVDWRDIEGLKGQDEKICCDITLFVEQAKHPVIGITGTNGKSTLVHMLHNITQCAGIKAPIGGNVGVAALSLLEQDADYYILELSSFQLQYSPPLPLQIASIINISEDHLDRHGSYKHYMECKMRIFQEAQTCIYRLEDNLDAPQDSISFTVNSNGDIYLDDNHIRWKDNSFDCQQLGCQHRYQIENAMVVIAIAKQLDINNQAIVKGIATYKQLPHRGQVLPQVLGREPIDNSKATNVAAACVALDSISDKCVLIAGGQAKNQDFSLLVQHPSLRAIVLIGQSAQDMQQICAHLPSKIAKDIQQAVDYSLELSMEGDSILLAPACASFDMFDDYEHRGKEFQRALEEIRCVTP